MNHSSQIDHFLVLRTLATGACSKLKVAIDTRTGQEVALKLLSLSARKHFHTEVTMLKTVPPHRGLVCIGASNAMANYVKKSGKLAVKAYIQLDLCPHGDLYMYVSQRGAMPHPIARWCFRQVVDALEHLHGCGVTHLDIKPENILVDASFRLRICDFGFATPNRNGLVQSMKGTRAYKAPETYLQEPFQGEKADVFSLAVTTFVLVTGKPPFSKADVMDSFYHFAAKGEWQRFWEMHKELDLSNEFKHLIEHMLCFDAHTRLSLQLLKIHPWTLGETASDADAQVWLQGNM